MSFLPEYTMNNINAGIRKSKAAKFKVNTPIFKPNGKNVDVDGFMDEVAASSPQSTDPWTSVFQSDAPKNIGLQTFSGADPNVQPNQQSAGGNKLGNIANKVGQGLEVAADIYGQVKNATANKVSKAIATTSAIAGFADNHVQAFRNQQRQQKLQQKSIFGTNSVLPQDNFNGSNPLMQQDDSFFLQEKGGKNTKPTKRTVYVENSNDPRLRAYQDSLALYNYSNQNRANNLIKKGYRYGGDWNDSQDVNANTKLTEEQKLEVLKALDVNANKGLQKIPVRNKPDNTTLISNYLGHSESDRTYYELAHGKIAPTEIATLEDGLWRNHSHIKTTRGKSEPAGKFINSKGRKNPNYKKAPPVDKGLPVDADYLEMLLYKEPEERVVLKKGNNLPTADDIERALRAKDLGEEIPKNLRYNRTQPLTKQELEAAIHAGLMQNGGRIMNVGGAVYDAAAFGANFIPGVGPAVSMGMNAVESMFDVTGRKKDARETAFINNKLPGALSGLSSYLPQAKNGSKIIDAPHMGGVYIEYDED